MPVAIVSGETVPGVRLTERAPGAVLFQDATRRVTARAFLGAAHRLADALPDGACVLNLCRDRYWFAVCFAAALLRGRPSLLSADRTPARLEVIARRYDGLCSVSDDPAVDSPVRRHLVVSPHETDGHETDGHGAAGGEAPNPALSADALAAIVFTSGSTGDPVAHEKHWGALAERSRAAGRRFGFDPDAPRAVVGTVPPQHMYGFETTVLLPLHAGAASWCGPAFYPTDVAAALAAAPGPRTLVTTPLQLRAFLAAGLDFRAEACISATAPLDPALAAEAERRWGTQVLEIYGATEAGSIASRRTVAEDAWTPYPGVTLSWEAGIASVSAPGAAPVPLGDEVEPLGDGRFRLLGRAADVLKVGGRRASLAGLNRILLGVDGVQDGAFVVPEDLDHRPTARLLAFAVAPGRTAEDVLAALRERVDPVFLPRRVVLVERLPRDELGKLPRRALAALQAGLDAG